MAIILLMVSLLEVRNVPTDLYSGYMEVEAVEGGSLSSVL
jgi:hypothetical protein